MWGERVMEKVRVSANCVFEMVTLVNNMNVRTVKVKKAISNDTMSIEEVVDLGDNESTNKTGAGEDGEVAEGLLD
jgi:hypothetical protein